MNNYVGIEKIDPMERLKQHELTKSLWKELCGLGIKTGDKGRIKAFLASDSYEQAMDFKIKFQDDDFEVTIFEQEEDSELIIQLITPVSRLSIEAFIELADILMIYADETKNKFDGFELDLNEVKKLNRPWWKIW